MSGRPKIAVIGSYMADLVSMAPRLPRPGETVSGGPFFSGSGGKGSNQAVAAARLGADVGLLLSVGSDDFGRRAVEFLANEGLDTKNVRLRTEESTGVALIIVDSTTGENQITIAPGANNLLSPNDVDEASADLECAGCLILQLEIPMETVSYALDWACSRNMPAILNPAPIRHLDEGIFRKISIMTPNEHEASQLTGIAIDGEESARKAALRIVEYGCKTAIVTLGEKGAMVAEGGNTALVPAYKVKAVDTTGAGDAFNGALAFALASKLPLYDSVRFANACAAISVTRMGTAVAMPRQSEVDDFLAGHKII